MEKHRAVIAPKFELVKSIFTREFSGCDGIARWTDPNGGYFLSLYTVKGCAKRTVQLCAEAGVKLTEAGAAYPYGVDPDDWNIRIAPTYPPLDELETAAELLVRGAEAGHCGAPARAVSDGPGSARIRAEFDSWRHPS